MIFSTFQELYSQYYNPVLERFHHTQGDLSSPFSNNPVFSPKQFAFISYTLAFSVHFI